MVVRSSATRRVSAQAAFADALEPLARQGWRILHGRRLPRSPADIDHLLAGPPGVFVVDSKAYKGRLKVYADNQVMVGTRHVSLEIDKVVGYARAVENVSWQHFPGTLVIPVVCFTRDVGLTTPVLSRGAWLARSDHLLSWLAAGLRLLSPQEVWALGEHLESAYPSRSGGVLE